jgi:hypothetical protein
MPSLGAVITNFDPPSFLCGRSSSSYLLTLRGLHVTTHQISWKYAVKWSLPLTFCVEPQKPRVYRDRPWHCVLPDDLARFIMNNAGEKDALAFQQAVLSMVAIK